MKPTGGSTIEAVLPIAQEAPAAEFFIPAVTSLANSTCHERLALRHFGTTPQTLHLGLSFAADFADLFEVRGSRRERRGVRQPAIVGKPDVELGYTGLDGR